MPGKVEKKEAACGESAEELCPKVSKPPRVEAKTVCAALNRSLRRHGYRQFRPAPSVDSQLGNRN
jgi:hypothetical protein